MARKRGSFLSNFKLFDTDDERVPKLLGLFMLFLSLYLTIAFVSYLFTWEEDASVVNQFSFDLLFMGEQKMSNWLGRLGAMASHGIISMGFGLPSFGFIYLLVIYGRALIIDKPLSELRWRLRYTVVLMVFGSILLRFLFQKYDFYFGGVFGQVICDWIIRFVGNVGMFILIFMIFIFIITWNFNPDYSTMTYDSAKEGTRGYLQDWWYRRYRQMRGMPVSNTNSNAGAAATAESIVEASKNAGKNYSKAYNSVDSINDSEKEDAPLEDVKTGATGTNVEPLLDENNQLAMNIGQRDIKMPRRSTSGTGLEMEIEESVNEFPTNGNDPDLDRLKLERMIDGFDDEPTAAELTPQQRVLQMSGPYDPTLELSSYEHPVLQLLDDYSDQKVEVDRTELESNKDQIIATLLNYKIEIIKIKATIGPTVTLYEIVPAPGVRISKIKSLEDDIALSLAALGIRIIAPIPGKGTIGIEVPNRSKQIVSLREVLMSEKFRRNDLDLPIALGKTISNEVFVADLTKMPHLLIAGATGQGKSVGINAVLMSLLYKKHPSQVKLILIDPKKVELFPYSAIENHFLGFLPDQLEPIVTDTTKVIHTLNSLCIEMDDRYDLLKKAAARNIKEYNEKFIARTLNPEKGHRFLPFIVFADLIMTAGKEIELPIGRLAQLSRAVGIHLIIATQRPSVNIITGVIKANFPARIAFKVSSKVDSRTILDSGGAEQLIGRGDMLLSIGGDMVRLQCAFVDTPEVERVINFIAKQPAYPTPFFLPEYKGDDADNSKKESFDVKELDDYFEDAAKLVVQNQHGSTSMIQRRLKLGYNRAGRIMDQLEAFGIVGPSEGSKPREVLFFDDQELERFLVNLKSRK
jgi:DNA segregation ATPase FtsK/SpoIIIE, S-DNA-T family